MYIWFLLILFLIFVKLCMGNLGTPQKRKKYLIIAGIATILLMALRGENYGSVYDIRAYKGFYERMIDSSWADAIANDSFEIGYVVLNKLLGYIAPFSQAILVFHAIFCIFCVCRFIYLNTEKVFWGYFFFVTLGTMGFMMTGIRQAIAMGICLLNTENIKEKRIIRFLIYVLLASTIHRTAFIFIAAYFVCNAKVFKKIPWLSIFVIVGISALAPQVIDIGESIYEDFSASDVAAFSFNGIVPVLIYIIAIVLNLLYKSKNENNSNNMMLTSMAAGFYLFRFYSPILERISFYYTPASTVLLADFMDEIKTEERQEILIKLLVIVLCVILFARRLDTAAWANYVFLWEAA